MNTNTGTGLTVAGTLHFARRGRGGRKEGREGTKPAAPSGRVPRVSRLMALALKFDRLIRDGDVTDQAELARLGHVTRARMSQIMALLHLAPDIQEALLFLPAVERGRDPIILRPPADRDDPRLGQTAEGVGGALGPFCGRIGVARTTDIALGDRRVVSIRVSYID